MIRIRPIADEPADGTPDRFVEATFTIPARSDIACAALVGDFNGWSPIATPLEHVRDVLVATVTLAAGYRYRFKYLVNGESWENDWAADDYLPNTSGGEDSILDLTARALSPVGATR